MAAWIACPPGDVLGAALQTVGVRREDLSVTNAVKHFHHEPAPRGKRRLHKRTTIEHVTRCQPWLDADLAILAPRARVCLGATAARAVFGPPHRMPTHWNGRPVYRVLAHGQRVSVQGSALHGSGGSESNQFRVRNRTSFVL